MTAPPREQKFRTILADLLAEAEDLTGLFIVSSRSDKARDGLLMQSICTTALSPTETVTFALSILQQGQEVAGVMLTDLASQVPKDPTP